MTDMYRLVFRGEVNEGQHAAVVKKRLAALLKLDDARADALFSGKAVVVKKAVDRNTAIRYRDAFNQAGARLRVGKVEQAGAKPSPAESDTASPGASAQTAGGMAVLPVGSDVLTEEERADPVEVDVDISHLSVQGAVFITDDEPPAVPAPNVDHISMAEVGARIGEESTPAQAPELDADFEVAEVGARMGNEGADPEPAVNVDDVDFDVADVGADMDTKEKKPPPPPPDTSHISVEPDT